MAKSALKHQNCPKHQKFHLLVKLTCLKQKCLKHLKTAQNIKSFIFWCDEPFQVSFVGEMEQKYLKRSKNQKLHFMVKWAKFESKNS